jgi:parallel beta-helix repeat protein
LQVFNLPATITATTTLTTNNVYVVTGQTTINAGVTITIQPGVIVKFQNSGSTKGKLIVNGNLQALGTSSNRVIFTSIHDDSFGGDTNQNGGASRANPGDWDGISFGSTSSGSALDNVLVMYGGSDSNIVVNGASVNLSNSVISYSSSNGLHWMNGASGQIIGNRVEHSLGYGLYLSGSSTPAVTGNTLADNRSYAIYMEGNSPANFGANNAYGNLCNPAQSSSSCRVRI